MFSMAKSQPRPPSMWGRHPCEPLVRRGTMLWGLSRYEGLHNLADYTEQLQDKG